MFRHIDFFKGCKKFVTNNCKLHSIFVLITFVNYILFGNREIFLFLFFFLLLTGHFATVKLKRKTGKNRAKKSQVKFIGKTNKKQTKNYWVGFGNHRKSNKAFVSIIFSHSFFNIEEYKLVILNGGGSDRMNNFKVLKINLGITARKAKSIPWLNVCSIPTTCKSV